jgi:DNA-binding CsgD family transcriptional regulator
VLPWRPQAVAAAMPLDDLERAAALAEEEVHEAGRIGLPARIGAALHAQAVATADVDLRTERLREAVAALEPAIDRLELAALVKSGLAATGARTRRATASDELTATELQVAQPAADGMTNQQIAGRLVITPKTVEWHLTHAYAKLGVKSRRRLADALNKLAAG